MEVTSDPPFLPPERYVSSKNQDFSEIERSYWQLFFFSLASFAKTFTPLHHKLFSPPRLYEGSDSLERVCGIAPFKRVAKNCFDSPETSVTSQGFWW